MPAALGLIVQLLPALAGVPMHSDTVPTPAEASIEYAGPRVNAPIIDWIALRGTASLPVDTARIRDRTFASASRSRSGPRPPDCIHGGSMISSRVLAHSDG